MTAFRNRQAKFPRELRQRKKVVAESFQPTDTINQEEYEGLGKLLLHMLVRPHKVKTMGNSVHLLNPTSELLGQIRLYILFG